MKFKINPDRARYVLLLKASLVYLPLLGAPALSWDDDSNIFANPFFRAGDWVNAWTSAYYGLYVPVTSFVWQILFTLGHGQAWPFRLMNVALHVANVALVYVLLKHLAVRARWASAWPAVIGAATFALHPLQAGAVAWISGGRDLLAAFFSLICLILYLRKQGWSRAVATLMFALATLSKPSAVALPLIAFVLNRVANPGERARDHVAWLGGWVAFALAITWLTLGAQDGHAPAVTWWQRPWLMGDAFAFYELRVLNVISGAINYARTPDVVIADHSTLIGAAGAWITLALLWSRQKFKAVAPFAAAWALALLPVSGLVSFGYQRVSGVADHYAYFAMAMLAAIVATITNGLMTRTRRPELVIIAGLVVTVGLGFLSTRRVQAWQSDETVFTEMARSAPRAYVTGIGMSFVACGEQRDFAAGVRWTEVALNDRPLDVRALANLAYCLVHDRKFARAAELEFYLDKIDQDELALRQPTGYSSFLASVGTAKIELRDFEDGYQFLCEAARVLPSEPLHARNLTAAARILRDNDLEPACESEEDAPGT